ncbi:MAG: hypothetical protein AAGA50_03585 [Pseudomonadota bacterium]
MAFWKIAKGLAAITVASVGVCTTSGLFAQTAEEIVLQDRWALKWAALDVAKKSQDLADDKWSAMVGVNSSALDLLFDGLEGTSLTHSGVSLLKGTEITIESISFETGIGSLDASVMLRAKKGPVTLGLALEGSLFVNGIVNTVREVQVGETIELKPVTEVSFRIEPTRIVPSLGSVNLERSGQHLWSELAPGLASALLNDDLFTVTADLPRELRTELGKDDETTEVIDEERGATVTYRTNLPASELRVKWAFGAPISTGDAYWLMARELSGTAPDIQPDTPPDLDATGMEMAVRKMNNELQKRLPKFVTGLGVQKSAGISLIVDGNALVTLSRIINRLDASKRRVHVQLVNRTGRLAQDRWRDNILGEGGIYAEIGCPDCAEFNAQLNGVYPLVQDDSVSVKAEVSVDGWVNVAAHIDPLIGGGAGTSAKIEGRTRGVQTIGAEVTASLLEDPQGHRVAALTWQPSCKRLDVVATTDGRLKLDFGWASLPKVGARMKMVAGPSVIEPIVAFDTLPYLIEYLPPTPLAKTGTGKDWTLRYPNIGTIVTTSPFAFRIENGDLMVSAEIRVVNVADRTNDLEMRGAAAIELRKRNRTQQESARAATDVLIKKSQQDSQCKGIKPSVAFLLGGIEIGENNEFVKFFRNAWNDILNGPGPNNEMVKALDAAGATFHQADAIRLNITNGLLNETGKVIAYGDEAVRNIERAAEKAAEDAARAAEKAAQDAARAAEKAAQDAARAAEKAAQDAARATEKAAQDAARAAEKAARDLENSTKRNGRGCFGLC